MNKDSEKVALTKAAKEYLDQGYEVTIYPTKDELPMPLKGQMPDLIAFKDNQYVIVEVKSKLSPSEANQLKVFADIAEKQGWRFDLISIDEDTKPTLDILTQKDMELTWKKISDLKHLGFNNSAFVYVWAMLETLMRSLVAKENIRVHSNTMYSPLLLVKTLYSYGVLEEEDFNKLKHYFSIRNRIVHELNIGEISGNELEDFIVLAKKFINEN
ncbi:hypothetical protein [Desulfosporosinus sp. SB140]|uniref:hypothetical protein n=1 Tax=Desulfosporosinus paludis TaxID=3115649 RepID=UPI00388F79D5